MNIKSFIFFFIISILPALLLVFLITPVEFFFLDVKFIISMISYRTYDISDYLVIVLIDTESEKKLSLPIEGKGWRKYDSEIIGLLKQNKALVITFDVEFSGEGTLWDENLAAQYREAGNVITCEIHEGATIERFRESLYSIGNASVKNFFGRPRKINLFPDNNSQKAFSFEVATAYFNFLGDNDTSKTGSRKHNLEKALSDKEYWINYKYPIQYFPVFSYVDLLYSQDGRIGNKEKTPLSVIKNKIVLFAKDFQKDKIPLPNNFGNKVFGGLVHAYGIETLLNGSGVQRIPLFLELLVLIFIFSCIHLILYKLRGFKSILFVFLICFFTFICQLVLFQMGSYWVLYAPLFTGSVVSVTIYGIYKRYTLRKEFRQINTQVRRLARFNTQLEETGKLKDILTDTLVHDIKNAIAAIEGSLYFITEKYKEDSQSLEVFHAASIACTDIISLSSNLLDVRNIEEGKLELCKEPCSFDQIREMIDRFTHYPLFYEKKISVEIIPLNGGFSVSVDTYLLEQIFHNLLNNALKYTPISGRIIISFENGKGDETIMTFFNSGKPISEGVKDTVFEKYKRGKKKRSKYSKGLGLYFCRMAMEMQGGRIWLETDEIGNYFKLGFTG